MDIGRGGRNGGQLLTIGAKSLVMSCWSLAKGWQDFYEALKGQPTAKDYRLVTEWLTTLISEDWATR
jgi:hypothetical protein